MTPASMTPASIISLILAPVRFAFDFASLSQAHEAETEANLANQRELGVVQRAEQGNAIDTLARGYQQAGLGRMAASQTLAKQQTAFANSGVLASVGTPAATTAGSQLMADWAARITENDALRAALGHKAAADKAFRQRGQLVLEQRARDAALPLRLASSATSAAASAVRSIGGGGE